MPKPPKYQCNMYCKDYEGCTRTSCQRTPLFLHGIKTVMAEPRVTNPITLRIKRRMYNEDITKIKNF